MPPMFGKDIVELSKSPFQKYKLPENIKSVKAAEALKTLIGLNLKYMVGIVGCDHEHCCEVV
jgi:hypothetical protein